MSEVSTEDMLTRSLLEAARLRDRITELDDERMRLARIITEVWNIASLPTGPPSDKLRAIRAVLGEDT